ncbi:hypothetical protein FXO37_06559 [Capsicum annuum]|nr:hypothetical protein FXO37_06559 [Capsicum annuum]
MGSLRKGTQRVLLLHEEEEGEEEPILKEQPQKYCTFPITYPQLWEMYKKAQASFWTGGPASVGAKVHYGEYGLRLYQWRMYMEPPSSENYTIFTWLDFSTDSYSIFREIDKLIPVDVYLPEIGWKFYLSSANRLTGKIKLPTLE